MSSVMLLQKSLISERCSKLFGFNQSFNKCLWIDKLKKKSWLLNLIQNENVTEDISRTEENEVFY
jgi:hypothetical protein